MQSEQPDLTSHPVAQPAAAKEPTQQTRTFQQLLGGVVPPDSPAYRLETSVTIGTRAAPPWNRKTPNNARA
jgi:hypothetical protein